MNTEAMRRFESSVTAGLPKTGRPTEEQLLQLAAAFRASLACPTRNTTVASRPSRLGSRSTWTPAPS